MPTIVMNTEPTLNGRIHHFVVKEEGENLIVYSSSDMEYVADMVMFNRQLHKFDMDPLDYLIAYGNLCWTDWEPES